jgi:hypothetical protein
MNENLQKMLALVGEFFDTKNDPDQISVTEDERDKLDAIHPSTLSEYSEGNGPLVWVLVVPTTEDVMNRFLKGEISEKTLLEETLPGIKYDAVYLCSALVLPEYRRHGFAKKITVDAINEIRKDHKITALFYWQFSKEGAALAEAIAKEVQLPLYKR